jgi:dihydrofolate synthase/folylpolyglutamate synthase
MRDKAIEEVAEILFPLAHELILTAPDSSRAIRPEALAALAGRGRCMDLETALETVRAEADSDDMVVITGSLFLIGEARRAYSSCRGQLWDTSVL